LIDLDIGRQAFLEVKSDVFVLYLLEITLAIDAYTEKVSRLSCTVVLSDSPQAPHNIVVTLKTLPVGLATIR
jgi:uncharacterized protein YwbE